MYSIYSVYVCVCVCVCFLPLFIFYSVKISDSYNTVRVYWSLWGNDWFLTPFKHINTQIHRIWLEQPVGRNRSIWHLILIVISLPVSYHLCHLTQELETRPAYLLFWPLLSSQTKTGPVRPANNSRPSASTPVSMSCSDQRAPSNLTNISSVLSADESDQTRLKTFWSQRHKCDVLLHLNECGPRCFGPRYLWPRPSFSSQHGSFEVSSLILA